jgi:hypothetical protein
MEPWDGPAMIAFSDGRFGGAVLDRNGLRPGRYYVTQEDMVIFGSEAGLVQVTPSRIKKKGRVQPGKIFLVDFERHRILTDEELKEDIAAAKPYHKWIQNMMHIEDLPPAEMPEMVISSKEIRTFDHFARTHGNSRGRIAGFHGQ